MDYKELHKKLLKKVQPDSKYSENLKKIVKEFIPQLKHLKVFIGGSYAKGTWLPKIKDVDLFILFPYSQFKNKSISQILEKRLSSFRYQKVHGSRDYFRINYKRINFEIIPILKINRAEEAINITDISPLHVKWVNSHPKVKEEIRILKLFLKANNLYGAESYIRGFSGYACEILICHYKSFLNLIKDALNWEDKKIIDVERHYKDKDEILKELNPSKRSPLIIIDPVQKTRNAGASISQENYNKFKEIAKRLLQKPELKLFRKNKLSKETLKKKYPKNIIVSLEVKPLEGKEDIVLSKVLKIKEYMSNRAKEYGFEIIKQEWNHKNKLFFVFKDNIPRYHKIQGPFLKQEQNIESFKQKHKPCFNDNSRIWAKEKREFTSPISFILNLIKEDYITEKVKSIKLI